MRLFNLDHEFDHSWETVTIGQWQKYPNPQSSHVIHVDVLSRTVHRGILRTERLIAVKQPIPGFIARFFGIEDSPSYVREISEVDPVHKTFKAISTNLSYCNTFKLLEKVQYAPMKPHPNRTLLDQEVQIEVRADIAAIRNAAEEFFVRNFEINAARGRQGLEQVIASIFPHEESTLPVG